ncbi:MAG: hypothetical protein QXU18_07465 [Thermoplasmatales archaeon]
MVVYTSPKTYDHVKAWLSHGLANKYASYVTLVMDNGFVRINLFKKDKVKINEHLSEGIRITSEVATSDLSFDYRSIDAIVIHFKTSREGYDEVIFMKTR